MMHMLAAIVLTQTVDLCSECEVENFGEWSSIGIQLEIASSGVPDEVRLSLWPYVAEDSRPMTGGELRITSPNGDHTTLDYAGEIVCPFIVGDPPAIVTFYTFDFDDVHPGTGRMWFHWTWECAYEPPTEGCVVEYPFPNPWCAWNTGLWIGRSFLDENGIYTSEYHSCSGDLNWDWEVDAEDLALVVAHWGDTSPRWKVSPTSSAPVGINDLWKVIENWGGCDNALEATP